MDRLKERKLCVEDCQKMDAKTCPKCGRNVEHLYARPCPSFVAPVWECRLCLDLTYFSAQSRKTRAGNLLRTPGALYQAERELFKAMETISATWEPPPDEVVKRGRRAIAHWFKDGKAERKELSRRLDVLERIPDRLRNAALRERLPERKPLRK